MWKAEAERVAHKVEERRACERAEREARAALLWAAEEERCKRVHEAAEKGKGKVSIVNLSSPKPSLTNSFSTIVHGRRGQESA